MQIFIPLCLVISGVVFQIYLTKQKNKLLGLILPLIAFLYALGATTINYLATSTITTDEMLILMILFVVRNVPTSIFIGLYFSHKNDNDKPSKLGK